MITQYRDRHREPAPSEHRDAALERFELGRAAWPNLPLEFAAFEAYFAEHAAAA